MKNNAFSFRQLVIKIIPNNVMTYAFIFFLSNTNFSSPPLCTIKSEHNVIYQVLHWMQN